MKTLNTYLNDKNNLIVFLIILIGVLVPYIIRKKRDIL